MQPQVRPDLDSPRRGRPPGIDPSSGGTAHLRRLAKETARDLVAMSTGARTAPNLHARLTVATGARQRGAGQRGRRSTPLRRRPRGLQARGTTPSCLHEVVEPPVSQGIRGPVSPAGDSQGLPTTQGSVFVAGRLSA